MEYHGGSWTTIPATPPQSPARTSFLDELGSQLNFLHDTAATSAHDESNRPNVLPVQESSVNLNSNTVSDAAAAGAIKTDAEDYDEIFKFLLNKVYPEGCDRANFRRKARSFWIVDQKLHYKGTDEIPDEQAEPFEFQAFMQNRRAWIVDLQDRKRIIQAAHEFGHMGRKRTYESVKMHYYWLGMYDDVEAYVKSCDKCQRVKNNPLGKSASSLHPIHSSRTFERGVIDLIGPLTETASGMKYIAVWTDHFSKYAFATPIPSKEAVEVARFVLRIIREYGTPEILQSDQGREFNNQLLAELAKAFQIDHRVSSAYHPQTNGITERFNQTLEKKLRSKMVTSNDWDEHVADIVAAYNSTEHASTKVSPFEAMFLRKYRSLSGLIVDPGHIRTEDGLPVDSKAEDFETTFSRLKEMRLKVDAASAVNIAKAQARNKADYDRRHEPPKFQVGDMVLVENSRKRDRKGDKLGRPYLGPDVGGEGTYTVDEVCDKGMVKLKNSRTGVLEKNRRNTAKLKRYIPRVEADQVDNAGSEVLSSDSEDREPDARVDRSEGTGASRPAGPAGGQSESSVAVAGDEVEPSVVCPPSDNAASNVSAGNKGKTPKNGLVRRARKPAEKSEVYEGDLDEVVTGVDHPEKWVSIPGLYTLDERDLDRIRASDGRLNDEIMNAVQAIARKHNPNLAGLAPVAVAMVYDFAPVSAADHSAQVLHTGQGHWVLGEGHGHEEESQRKVSLCDSFPTAGQTNHVAIALCQLFANFSTDRTDTLRVELKSVQHQQDGFRCGVMTAANLWEVADGKDPSLARFDLSKMRAHLEACLEAGKFERFPQVPPPRNRRREFTAPGTWKIRRMCDCGLPEQYDECLVSCRMCHREFHAICAGFTPGTKVPANAEYRCGVCTSSGALGHGRPRKKACTSGVGASLDA
eukprot:TRINITY_DN339_c0_g1_i2.p1 TRINITY_DN339_c0_g1~~TRINITY_DN339_c0_g1_i2.p1  ORF type:complete len:947 (-),score=63.67 TRINITY_DN339_c0_g1_i2:465-3221(-)